MKWELTQACGQCLYTVVVGDSQTVPSAHKDDCWHIGQAHTTPIWACTTYLRSI